MPGGRVRVRRPVRSISGVSVVAIMSKPYPCPHGRCIYCPGGPDEGTPQSYIGEEPALMRAKRVNYHPYRQVYTRLRQYEINGHVPSKVELIIMGGTFLAQPPAYKRWFIASAFEGLNRYPEPEPPLTVDLELAHARNERARIRCVGLTFETRPDWGKEKHADEMLEYGGTRVELGVQTIYDEILERIRRGHSTADTIEATRILKDSGFKIVYHIMLGLPGSDPDMDIAMAREIFSNPDFMPDMLKIYPTLVVRGTRLYEMWIRGEYSPYDDDTAVEVISKIYRVLPRWVRVMRVQRDVPADLIEAGPRRSNLRELVEERLREEGFECPEIRCREVGIKMLKEGVKPELENYRVQTEEYEASEGVEVFIYAEDPSTDSLLGFVRLRIPSERAHRREITGGTAIIRELHVFGPQVPVGSRLSSGVQHRGIGRALLKRAETLAADRYDARKIVVISGVGARQYYYRMGYHRPASTPYVIKDLH